METTLYAICRSCRKVSEVKSIRAIVTKCPRCNEAIAIPKPKPIPPEKKALHREKLTDAQAFEIYRAEGTNREVADRFNVRVDLVWGIRSDLVYKKAILRAKGLTKSDVIGIFQMSGTSREIADRYGVSVADVYRIKKREICRSATRYL